MALNALRALRHRNFALFIAGQACGLIGYWIQQLALSWLVYRITGSTTLLGLLGFAANLPVLMLAPVVGLWADRLNRHRMMIATQVLEMLQALALAALAFSGLIATWHIIVLASFLGICIAIELPVRHAYLPELIGDRQDLPNAVATMSLVANCGRLIGPSVAGLLIAWFSEATCFALNAASYVAVLVSFAFIRVKAQSSGTSHAPGLHGLREGLAYAWRTVPIRHLLSMLAVLALSAAPYGILMPAIVHEAFAGDAQTLGFLVGAAGVGAIGGTLLLAARKNVRGLTRLIVAAAFLAGCALMLMSWSRLFALSLVLMAATGFGILLISVSTNIILQTIVDDDKRGRVMSLYTAAFIGVMPIGGLLAGMLADRIGATHAMLVCGVVCVLTALHMAHRLPVLHQHMRPMYARLGIDA